MKYSIRYESPSERKVITLNGSKSISNRALIIKSLCNEDFRIENLSSAKDTSTLEALLDKIVDGATLDAGAAGTTFRFLTAHLALQNGTQILTGSARMKQRPIGVLVEALRSIGAKIEYLEKEGYPPLKIHELDYNHVIEISLSANVSSQYISALMLIAPSLPNGLHIRLEGDIVSLPYLIMTKNLMSYFGAKIDFIENTFIVEASEYSPKPFKVEGDWSAASYYYSIVAFEKPGYTIQLKGLFKDSVQGDQAISKIAEYFGVETSYNQDGVILKKVEKEVNENFNYDFILCPDLTQSVSIMMAGLGVSGTLKGLQTLRIKETDRILALQQELGKVNVQVDDLGLPDTMKQSGRVSLKNIPVFDTYEDHRMAMTLACLAKFGSIEINEPEVVEKSYPTFWEDIATIGFKVTAKD